MTNRLGTDVAPNHSVAAFFDNAMHGWGYNRHDTENQIRAQSVRLRNLVDEGLAKYEAQLRDSLAALRRALPPPTREEPFPPADAVARIAELDRFIRDMDGLRAIVQGAAVPSRDVVWRTGQEHTAFLDRLRGVDLELFTACQTAGVELPPRLKALLSKRESLLTEYMAFGP